MLVPFIPLHVGCLLPTHPIPSHVHTITPILTSGIGVPIHSLLLRRRLLTSELLVITLGTAFWGMCMEEPLSLSSPLSLLSFSGVLAPRYPSSKGLLRGSHCRVGWNCHLFSGQTDTLTPLE